MAVLNVRNLNMTFVERTLFDDVNFDVEEKDKIGLVGANGVGKTTIFKILTGILEPTAGDIFKSKDTVMGYMEQHACKDPTRSIYQELLGVFKSLMDIEKQLEQIAKAIEVEKSSENLDKLIATQMRLHDDFERSGGLTYKSRTRSALIGLGFDEKDFSMEAGKLSGGQLSKLSLAKLLLCGANLLLLDEPTNHLDIQSVEWLEAFIKDFRGAVLIVSHDRYFLDAVTNKTIELEHKKTTCYKGGYSLFLEKKEKINQDLQHKYENDIKEIKRIEGIVEQQKRWGRTRNFITAASKQKQADRLKEDLVTPDSELDSIHFRFEPKRVSGNDVLYMENLNKSFENKHIFTGVNMDIKRGERVFILGSNGCGKTTLFKILMNRLSCDSGVINYGSNVDVGYFDQVQANLDLNKTAIDEVWDAFPHMTQTQVRTALGSFLFKGDEVFKEQGTLSGGERARIALLKLMLQGSNLLLLDEPTNHLDTWSREALEDTLKEYDGTLLIISHDRYFINKLADRILYLNEDGITEYLGNYDYYSERIKNIQQAKDVLTLQGEEKPKVNEYKQRKEQQAYIRKLKNHLQKCEDEIERLDGEIQVVQEKLSSQNITADYEKLMTHTSKLEQLQKQQDEAYAMWTQLDEELKSADET
ncbi:MAG TPA: ABC-F family ATP-binding cassette domain-containing protein [Clostridiales bacterium]|nr:ABC-F family ATP-binding cassette domain-containing protein [Clostridiales bacterium]